MKTEAKDNKTLSVSDRDISHLIWALNLKIQMIETGDPTLCQNDVIRLLREAPNEIERNKLIKLLRPLDSHEKRQVSELDNLIQRLSELR